MRKAKTGILVMAALLLGGCGASLWPFSERAPADAPPYPPDAKVYSCEGNKRLVVWYSADGKYAMVHFPEREFRLDAVEPGSKFSNGRTVLTVQGNAAALEESGALQFGNCKPAAP